MAKSQDDLLNQTKALADPLRTITTVMFTLACLNLAFDLISDYASRANPYFYALVAAQVLIFCATLVFIVLVRPSRRTNAIYLRAFRTDRATSRLRDQLIGILGPEFRLSGIRPPRQKASAILRSFLPAIVALKYAGSTYMELEAGDEWLARLWRTYQNVRIVLIDLRDLTPFVQEEIRMTFKTVGAARCVFLTGQLTAAAGASVKCPPASDSEALVSEHYWRNLVAEVIGGEVDKQAFLLLDVRPERSASGHMQADFRAILDRLPRDVPNELAAGRQFILERVSADILKRSRKRSFALLCLNVFGVIATYWAFSLLNAWSFTRDNGGILVILSIPLLMLEENVVIRQACVARQLSRAHHSAAATKVWARLILVVLFLFVVPSGTLIYCTKRLMTVIPTANEISAIASLKEIVIWESEYSSEYPERGMTCSLAALGSNGQDAPSADGARLITDELASGHKLGYTFALSDCRVTAVNGQPLVTGYRLTAIPTSPRSGKRGFCTDEGGIIRFDPTGGTHCTEVVQQE